MDTIKGMAGIYGVGLNAIVNNKGEIDGTYGGIFSYGAVHLENSGEIDGMMAVTVGGGPGAPGNKVTQFYNMIDNHHDGRIVGDSVGVNFIGQGKQTLINDGFITGGEAAVRIDSGTAHIVNHGLIDGHVVLGAGNDVLDTRTGKINGEVHGGSGNDTYLVSKAHVKIVEEAGDGYDTVKSDANHSLAINVENLFLIGKGDVDGTGNASANILRGNAGDNVLKGLAGLDTLGGGKGDDFLTGGEAADTFVFYKGDGKDTITDFQHGSDSISLFNFTGDDDFFQIGKHMADHGKDVWITYGSDTLVLKGVHEADLNAADFNFPVML